MRVNVNCVSQTLRQVNMQFVIERGLQGPRSGAEHGAVRELGCAIPRA